MTIEEVIKKLKARIDDDFVNDEPYPYDLNIAIEALEKQIPKKPIDSIVVGQIGVCPSCNKRIRWRSIFKYGDELNISWCQECGQKLDWSFKN